MQANIRAYLAVREWVWMKLMFKIKPLLKNAEATKEREVVEKEMNDVREALEKEKTRRQELEEGQVSMIQEKNDLLLQLTAVRENILKSFGEKFGIDPRGLGAFL